MLPQTASASPRMYPQTANDCCDAPDHRGANVAFRWTAETGMQSLGVLFNNIRSGSEAEAISADGNWIVGVASVPERYNATAFLWDSQNGMRRLDDFLENEHGIDLQGIQLWNATGISANGRVIVGWGVETTGTQEFVAWRVDLGPVVPEPATITITLLAMILHGFMSPRQRNRNSPL